MLFYESASVLTEWGIVLKRKGAWPNIPSARGKILKLDMEPLSGG